METGGKLSRSYLAGLRNSTRCGINRKRGDRLCSLAADVHEFPIRVNHLEQWGAAGGEWRIRNLGENSATGVTVNTEILLVPKLATYRYWPKATTAVGVVAVAVGVVAVA